MPEPTALTSQQSFEKKLEDRIRADIGDLIPDEMLTQLVSKAIEKAFFEERTIKGSNYYDRDQKEVPWIVKLVKEELDKQVKAAVVKWVADNPGKVEKMIQDRIDEGFASAVVRSIDAIFQPAMNGLQNELSRVISDLRNNTLRQL